MAMTLAKSKVVSGGRVQLPAAMRNAVGLADGDTVVLELVDGEIHLRSQKAMLARVRARLRPYLEEGTSVVDELIAERRAEAARENAA
ncbi:MAG: AbrB/MazE/SpoVT family DNA-binding domain-containing protein [Sphingomonas sp.]